MLPPIKHRKASGWYLQISHEHRTEEEKLRKNLCPAGLFEKEKQRGKRVDRSER
jgi:hypothetical protein